MRLRPKEPKSIDMMDCNRNIGCINRTHGASPLQTHTKSANFITAKPNTMISKNAENIQHVIGGPRTEHPSSPHNSYWTGSGHMLVGAPSLLPQHTRVTHGTSFHRLEDTFVKDASASISVSVSVSARARERKAGHKTCTREIGAVVAQPGLQMSLAVDVLGFFSWLCSALLLFVF